MSTAQNEPAKIQYYTGEKRVWSVVLPGRILILSDVIR